VYSCMNGKHVLYVYVFLSGWSLMSISDFIQLGDDDDRADRASGAPRSKRVVGCPSGVRRSFRFVEKEGRTSCVSSGGWIDWIGLDWIRTTNQQ